MVDLEGLARVADEQLAVGFDAPLMDAEDAELAPEGIVDDLEAVGQGMQIGVWADRHRLHVRAFALHEGGRVALGGVGHELDDDLEQLADAGAGGG